MNALSSGQLLKAGISDFDLALRLIDTVPVPMGYLDADLVIRVVGKAAVDVIGMPAEEVLGKRVQDLFGEDNRASRALQQVAQDHRPRSFVMTALPGAAPRRHWEVSCVPDLADDELVGFIIVAFDVTDLVETQQRVTESEKLYRSISELLPFGMWTANSDGSITYFSDSFVQMTGRDLDSLLGWGWLDLLPSDAERNATRAEWGQDAHHGDMRDTKHVIRAKDGSYKHILCRGIRLPAGPDGKPRWAGIHADITESERQAQFREALSKVKDMLVTSLSTEELLARVGDAILGPTSADFAAVVMPHAGEWTIRYTAGYFPALSLDTKVPQEQMPFNLRAFKTGEAQVAVDATSDPRMNNEQARKDGLRSIAVLPIKRQGVPGCLLALAYTTSPIVADRPMMDFFSGLTDALDLALQSASVHEHQRYIAESLQESLLAVPESLPNVEFAHIYRAATAEERVGGDFYDAFECSGRIAFLVGDISGSGLEAAALTAQAKDTIRAHLMDNKTPGTSLTKANVVMNAFTLPHEFATVFVALFDPLSGRLRYACAGHPPPMIVGPRGVRLAQGAGMLLGAFGDTKYRDFTCRIHPDETIVLYTDGITEARGPEEMYGEERLRMLLASISSASPCEFVSASLNDARDFAGGRLDDDVALFAIRARPSS